MKKYPLALLGLLIALLLPSCEKAEQLPFRDKSLSTEQRIDDLLSRMTMEEKVGQMMNSTPAIERLGIPAYDWWNEALHGVARAGRATVFPQAIGLAATFDEEAMLETFEMISDEARAKYHHAQEQKVYGRYKGLTFWTPNVNIFRDPRWGRGMETYGEDPYLTSRMGFAAVKGLQGDDPNHFKTHACAKHYAVHSGPEWNRHEFNAHATPRDLRETYLPAFEVLVKDGNVREVMCAYNRLDGKPCCGSDKLLHQILREEWKYNGIVVSDCGAIDDFWKKDPNKMRHETHADAATASADAVKTGTDLECGKSYKSLLEAVKNGKIAETEIDTALRRLLRGRFELGMFDKNEDVKWASIPYSVVDSEKHRAKALEMARKSIVLLKNDRQVLPIKKDIATIAVIGPNANDSLMQWANYNGFPSSTKTILAGIKDKLPNANVIYEKGCGLTENFLLEELVGGITSGGKKGFESVYFGNTKLEGEPISKAHAEQIDFTTSGGAQYATHVPAMHFSARYTGEFKAPSTDILSFEVTGDDGFRLYINDSLSIDTWNRGGLMTSSVDKFVEKGKVYKIKIEYYQNDYDGQLRFSIKKRTSADFAKTAENVKDADLIVFVGGISPKLEGEEMNVNVDGFKQGDRTNINLPAVQLELLQELKKLKKPIVYVNCAGSSVDLSWVAQNVEGVVNAWYPGQAGGTAVADVLFGDYNPSGRLPITFYKSIDQLGDFEDYSMRGRTYRYFTKLPLYPFGYGLSYSKFGYVNAALSKKKMTKESTVDLTLTLQNRGEMAGDDVLQVYIKNNADKNGPIKTLRAFKRVNVAGKSSEQVTINLTSKAFESFYEDTETMDVRPGKYTIWVGGSSSEMDLKRLHFEIE